MGTRELYWSSGAPERRRAVKAMLVGACITLGLMASAGSASAVTLEGPWAPFDRCPVDDPAILAVTDSGNACVAADSPGGTFTIGDMTTPVGASNLQFGAWGSAVPNVVGATLEAEPSTVPGGLVGLDLDGLTDTGPLAVTAKPELAGQPQDFNLFGPLAGEPVVTLPIKIKLENPVLGDSCYIGSDEDPIVLHPVVTPVATFEDLTLHSDDPNGFPAVFIDLGVDGGFNQVDDTFAVPTSNGCGPGGVLSPLIDLRLGLPSPSGENEVVLEDVASFIGGSLPDGQTLSDAWHAAVIE